MWSRTPAVLTSNRLLVCITINLFATPGLGSLMARRRVAGAGQLILALAGSGLVMFWLCIFVHRAFTLAMDEPVTSNTHGWTLTWGIYIFAASWIWSLVTSAGIWIEARKLARAEKQNVPPLLK